MRTKQKRHETARSVVRHSATILFCALAALGLLRCSDPVGVPMEVMPATPRFVHFGGPDYVVTSIPIAPDPTPTGTHPNLAHDDHTTGLIPIGFAFKFFGITYNKINISTNGIVGFDPEMGNGCCQGEPIPRDDSENHQNNIIAGLWSDLSPDAEGQISYGIAGVAPNRRFVVHYQNVSFYPAGSPDRVDVQIKLFEGTNVIEVHSTLVPPDDLVHTQGIEDATGTDAYFVSGRVAANFELVNDAVRFTPPLDNTPPVVTYIGNSGAYTVDQSVSITCSASDETSGVASTTCADVSGDAYTFGLGTSTFSASATDNAGNVGSASTSFTVSVTQASLCNLVHRWVDQKGLAKSLCQQLSNGAYDAFRNRVEAQSGKAVPADKAALLISLSNEL